MTPRKKPEDLLPKGRKSEFTQDIANKICKLLAGGDSLRAICRQEDMPHITTVYDWMFKFPSFAEQYTRAREEQADTLADEIIAIADEDPTLQEFRDKDGNLVDIKVDSGYVAYQKQRIEARKWTAMKLKPKKYGDKVIHAGDAENPVAVEQNVSVFGELLKALKMARQAE